MTKHSTNENRRSTKAHEAGAVNRSTAKTDSWLYGFGQLLSQNCRGLSPIVTIGLNISNVLVDYPYGCGCVVYVSVVATVL